MNAVESIGNELSIKNDGYTINKNNNAFNIKTIKIKKKPFLYAFIGVFSCFISGYLASFLTGESHQSTEGLTVYTLRH